MNSKQLTERYQLSTDTDGLGWVPTFEGALKLAISRFELLGQTVRIFDRCAHYDVSKIKAISGGE